MPLVDFTYYVEEGLLPGWIRDCNYCPINSICEEYQKGRRIRCGLGHSYNYLFEKFKIPADNLPISTDKRILTENIANNVQRLRIVFVEEPNGIEFYNFIGLYKASINMGINRERLVTNNLLIKNKDLVELYYKQGKLDELENDLFNSLTEAIVLFLYDYEFSGSPPYNQWLNSLLLSRYQLYRFTYLICSYTNRKAIKSLGGIVDKAAYFSLL